MCCCVDAFFQVNGKTLKFKTAVIATGGSAALPPIPGLKEAPYLTNASIFNLTALPRRLVSITWFPLRFDFNLEIGVGISSFARRLANTVIKVWVVRGCEK